MAGFMALQLWRENSRYATRDDGAGGETLRSNHQSDQSERE